jgi:SAM-dependent methyltransferase
VNRTAAYLKYFFYLAYHWNFRLAATIIYYEIKGERKYRLHTLGIDDLKGTVSEADRKNASIYQPVNYFIAEWLFSQLSYHDIVNGTFLDAGCGKGRAMVLAAFAGFKTVRGIDISPKLCHDAINLLDSLQTQFPDTNFEISCCDAQNYQIADDITVLFLFNPFNKKIMIPFIEHVKNSLQRKPRNIKLLYANPECGDLWEDAGFVKIASKQKLNWLHGQVYIFRSDLNEKAGN